ncbi:polysaccharide pyruvyl transferase family protein [Zhongshania borealis]|uniref:Polysaccharide pyruvyl transferase domain-containing protein n=1 Tax=Zhongshania borealis TaxID=889488 RepID=A0ABP7WYF4_9GAMM
MIKLYYMKGGNNFGDILSKDIVAKVSGQDVVHAKAYRADIISTGSLLGKVQNTKLRRAFFRMLKPTYVWGTGIISDGGSVSKNNLVICALRGRLSFGRFDLNSDVALGDPALLCSKLFPYKKDKKAGKFLVTPHLHDKECEAWIDRIEKLLGEEVEVCNLSQDVDYILEKIANAKGVITSAMHPLIVAHSYRTPVVWVDVGSVVILGGNYKFEDYYSVLDIPLQKITKDDLLEGMVSKENIEDQLEKSYVGLERLRSLQDGLIASFPDSLRKK